MMDEEDTNLLNQIYKMMLKFSKHSIVNYNQYSRKLLQFFYTKLSKKNKQENIYLLYLIIHQKHLNILKAELTETKISKAMENDDLEIIKYLVENGLYKVNEDSQELVNDKQQTMNKPEEYKNNIFSACKNGQLQWLINETNLKTHDTNKDGETPLHCASECGQILVVMYLIGKGAKIEAKDKYGRTPLHYACINGFLPVVKYLLSKGANLEAKDNNGHLQLMNVLFNHGKK